MLVKAAKLAGKRYFLADENANQLKNNFSVVIGINGVGKSRLLGQIVSAFKGYKRVDYAPSGRARLIDIDCGKDFSIYGRSNEKISYIEDADYPAGNFLDKVKVIAVTTSPFDRFPVSYNANSKFKYRDDSRFHYIGLRVSENNFNKTNLLNLLSRSLLKKGVHKSYKSVFSLLNYKSQIRVEFKSKIPTGTIRDVASSIAANENKKIKKEFLLKIFAKYSGSLSKRIRDDNAAIVSAAKSLIKHFSSGDKHVMFKSPSREKDDLTLLLDLGIIYVKRVELYSKNDRVLDFSDSSSGEQCVLLSLLNLAGTIEDHSIICIDETEISLHPDWQRKYIHLLKDCFKGYKGCHFIISTHSPLIVSELEDNDCHVVDMVENKVYPAIEYTHRSADYQLATIFNTPGENNEYLKRRVVTLLSKSSKKEGLSEKESAEAQKLFKIEKDLPENDIVRSMIMLLRKGIEGQRHA